MNIKELILEKLITRQEHFISGQELSQSLQISRTAIWKAIKQLKEEGYEIEALKKTGYLLHRPTVISKEVIKSLSIPDNRIQEIQIKEHTNSTQIDAKRLALEKPNQDLLVISKKQTQTRGRFVRSYFAPNNDNFISMSLVAQHQNNFPEVTNYTLLAAVSVVKAIEILTDKKPEIKWVNDIYLNGKKICGILSEATTDLESNQLTSIIIGIGINFNIQPQEFPEELRKTATSLFVDEIPYISRNELIAGIWNQFYYLEQQDFLNIYRQYSFILGKNVTFIENGQKINGIAQRISDTGQLIIKLPNQSTKTLNSGEVSLQDWEEKVAKI
jgi:BirA family biotin operon repressor/biotin-[acetyl-CoA-carboxylase] ligase